MQSSCKIVGKSANHGKMMGKWWENDGKNAISSDKLFIRLVHLVNLAMATFLYISDFKSSPGRAWEKHGKDEKSEGVALQADLLPHPRWIWATFHPNHYIRARSLVWSLQPSLKIMTMSSKIISDTVQLDATGSLAAMRCYAMLCDVMRRYVAIQWIGVFWVKPWSHKWLVKALSQMPRPSDIHPCIQLVGWHEVELHDQMVACKDHVVAHPRGWTIRRIPGQRVGHLHWMLHVTCPHSPWMIRPKRGATWRNMVQCRSPWNIWNTYETYETYDSYMKHMKQRRSSFLRTECEVAKRLRNILKLRGSVQKKIQCKHGQAAFDRRRQWFLWVAAEIALGIAYSKPPGCWWRSSETSPGGPNVAGLGPRLERISNFKPWSSSLACDQNSDLINPCKSFFSKSLWQSRRVSQSATSCATFWSTKALLLDRPISWTMAWSSPAKWLNTRSALTWDWEFRGIPALRDFFVTHIIIQYYTWTDIYIYIHTYTHTHTYIYIYTGMLFTSCAPCVLGMPLSHRAVINLDEISLAVPAPSSTLPMPGRNLAQLERSTVTAVLLISTESTADIHMIYIWYTSDIHLITACYQILI